MRFGTILLAAVAVMPATASAQSMNAQGFYARAAALQKKGPFALLSGGEIKTLKGEGKAAGAQARLNRVAMLKAGQKPRYCPPEGKVSIPQGEFMTRLGAIPAAERVRIDMTEAMTRILTAKFPCPA